MSVFTRLKWKCNYHNIRQRYANFCGRLKRAEFGSVIEADPDVMDYYTSQHEVHWNLPI